MKGIRQKIIEAQYAHCQFLKDAEMKASNLLLLQLP